MVALIEPGDCGAYGVWHVGCEFEGERGLRHALLVHAEAELFHVAGPDFDLGEYVEGER